MSRSANNHGKSTRRPQGSKRQRDILRTERILTGQ
jgi:hypothetical protein